MKEYFQTWGYVSKTRRIPIIGNSIYRLIQFICGMFGHELSKTEWGYGGGKYADRWCRWCNKLIILPKDSVRFVFKDSSDLMNTIPISKKEEK